MPRHIARNHCADLVLGAVSLGDLPYFAMKRVSIPGVNIPPNTASRSHRGDETSLAAQIVPPLDFAPNTLPQILVDLGLLPQLEVIDREVVLINHVGHLPRRLVSRHGRRD